MPHVKLSHTGMQADFKAVQPAVYIIDRRAALQGNCDIAAVELQARRLRQGFALHMIWASWIKLNIV